MRGVLSVAILLAATSAPAVAQDKVYLTNSQEGRQFATLEAAVRWGDPEKVLAMGGTAAQALDALYEKLRANNPTAAARVGRIRDVSDGAKLFIAENRGKMVISRYGVEGSSIAISLDGQEIFVIGEQSEARRIITGEE